MDTNKYLYFRKINNVTDDLSLFIIMRRITHDDDNNDLYSYIFFLRHANERLIHINDINKILLDKKFKIKFPSILETVWDFTENIISVTSIVTDNKYRNRGLGSLLMISCAYIAEHFGLKSIELDDMTDNFRKSNNFYSNLSFRYVEDGMPEMVGFCNQIVRKWRHIKKKYDLQFDIFKSLIPKRSTNIY
tara:strand:+ start:113 stop:682 length:570 start_codon:yes stop_codon:yes gene_type:complete